MMAIYTDSTVFMSKIWEIGLFLDQAKVSVQEVSSRLCGGVGPERPEPFVLRPLQIKPLSRDSHQAWKQKSTENGTEERRTVVAVNSHDQLAVRPPAGTRTLRLDGVLLCPTRLRHGNNTLLHQRTPVPTQHTHSDNNHVCVPVQQYP